MTKLRRVAYINPEPCIACGRCSRDCPYDAIMIGDLSIRVVDTEACTGCMECEPLCPRFTIEPAKVETRLAKKRKKRVKEKKRLPTQTHHTTPITSLPDSWDEEVDIVVAGCGAAGVTAALTAAEKGAKVLILEKEAFGGGNSATLNEAPGVVSVIDEEKGMKHLKWLTAGLTEEEVLRANLEYSAQKMPRFLESLGLPMAEKPFAMPYGEYSNAPGYGGLGNSITMKIKGGPVLIEAMIRRAEEAGINILYNTRALRLIQNPDTREIFGLVADREGEKITIKGRKATVIATGGFGNNEEMLRQYITPSPIYFVGATACTGDGIRMTQAVGAQLWHMNGLTGPMQWAIKVDGDEVYNTFSEIGMDTAGLGEAIGGAEIVSSPCAFQKHGSFIWVNKYGRRFDNEITVLDAEHLDDVHGERHRENWLSFDPIETVEFRNLPAFQIFDEKARLAGPLVETRNMTTIPWSKGGMEELKKGWLIKGDTIEELAAKCVTMEIDGVTRGRKISPEILKETIERYNKNCLSGVDPDFGRTKLLEPLNTPPYYAMGPMFPSFIITYGGPKHDAEQRVLDVDNNPIPRLYAIGDCGSLNACRYALFGGTEMITSGLNCGEHAVLESDWDKR